MPVTNHLHLLRVSPYRAICELPVGTANGDMLIGRFERAIIRRHFPTGRGTDILDQNFLPNAQHLGAQSLASFDALFNESQPMLPYSYQNPGVARLDNNTVYSRKILDGNDVRTTVSLGQKLLMTKANNADLDNASQHPKQHQTIRPHQTAQ